MNITVIVTFSFPLLVHFSYFQEFSRVKIPEIKFSRSICNTRIPSMHDSVSIWYLTLQFIKKFTTFSLPFLPFALDFKNDSYNRVYRFQVYKLLGQWYYLRSSLGIKTKDKGWVRNAISSPAPGWKTFIYGRKIWETASSVDSVRRFKLH